MDDQPRDELDWQAFRYIAAEMSPDEVAQFEEQLSGDQARREAVAGAVELAEALAVVSAGREVYTDPVRPTHRRTERSTWWARLGWIGVGAAAALACIFLFRAIRVEPGPDFADGDGPNTPPGVSSSDDEEATQLARLWCRTRDELEPVDDDMAWPSPDLVDPLSREPGGAGRAGVEEAADMTNIVGSDDDLPGDTADTVEAVPSWMLAALAGEADRGDDGLPEREAP